MERQEKILLLCTLCFVLTYAWSWVPESECIYSYFPFSTQLVTRQVYFDYAFRDVIYVILFYLLSLSIPILREYLVLFWVLWLGYLIDYLLCYNEPFGHILSIPVSYSLIAGLSMICLTLHFILKK